MVDVDASGWLGTAGGGSLGGVNRFGRTPWRDQRLALLVPELRFVLKLALSTLRLLSLEASVETDCREDARGLCSGVPNWNSERGVGLVGGSVSTLSVDITEAEKLVRRDRSTDWVSARELVYADVDEVHRFRGGGWSESAPIEKALLVLSLVTGVASGVAH